MFFLSFQVYFEKTISITDISWSDGLTISQGEFTWTLNIIGANIGDDENSPKPIFNEKNLEDMMLLAYYRTLGQLDKVISKHNIRGIFT